MSTDLIWIQSLSLSRSLSRSRSLALSHTIKRCAQSGGVERPGRPGHCKLFTEGSTQEAPCLHPRILL